MRRGSRLPGGWAAPGEAGQMTWVSENERAPTTSVTNDHLSQGFIGIPPD
jgi:hypothetical protein